MPYMQSHHQKISCLSLAFSVLFCFFVVSCSQNTPEIFQPDYSVIFDYTSENLPPSSRLAVYMASVSDVKRYETLKIKSLDTDYTWYISDIQRLAADGLQWAGCNNLVPPDNEKIPAGYYEVTYYNADEKETSFTFKVTYDEEFYDIMISDLPSEIIKKNGYEKIIIYDKEKTVLFFGPRPDEFRTVRGIWNVFREADTYRIMWYANNGRVICMEPERKVVPGEDD